MPSEAQWAARSSGPRGGAMEWWSIGWAQHSTTPTKKPGHYCAGLRGKIEREAQCLQVLQSADFLPSQQEAALGQHSFLGASGQDLQLVRPRMEATRARVASAFMRMVLLLLDGLMRRGRVRFAIRYECAKQALFLASTKSQLCACFAFSAAMWRARLATSMR